MRHDPPSALLPAVHAYMRFQLCRIIESACSGPEVVGLRGSNPTSSTALGARRPARFGRPPLSLGSVAPYSRRHVQPLLLDQRPSGHPRLVSRAHRTGNLPLFPGIFPDQFAPIVRIQADGERELVMARWGNPVATLDAHGDGRQGAHRQLRLTAVSAQSRLKQQ